MAEQSTADAPLVIQLQMAAIDSTASVSSILLKAKLVASKLGMGGAEISDWIGHELDGYVGSGATIPGYRLLAGQPLALNPVRGEIPVQVGQPNPEELQRALFELPFTNAIPEIEALIAKGNVSNLRVPFPSGLQHLVSELTGLNFPLRWAIGPGQLAGLVEAVRSRTMQWALDLETGGVLGADFKFTLSERNAAVTITNNFTNSNIGNVGDVSTGAQVTSTQTITNTVAIDKLAAFIEQLDGSMAALPTGVRAALVEPVQVLKAEAKAAAPSQGKIRSALNSIRTTCEGAAGNLIASGVISMVGALLA